MPSVSTIAPPLPDFYEISEDGEIKLKPHPGQQRALAAEERFVVVLAGSQSGKTVTGPWWLWLEMQRMGPGDYLVAAPTFTLMEPKILPTFLEVFDRLLNLGTFVRSPSMRFTLSEDGCRALFGDDWDENGPPTTIYFGYATKPDSLESATYKAAWLDEAGQDDFKLDSWQAILRRLSIASGEVGTDGRTGGRVFLTTTVYNLGWIKASLYDKRLRDQDPDIRVIHFDSTENPRFPREEWERAKADLPEWKFNMFYRGQFTRPPGMIYDSYDENAHEIARQVIPDEWRRFVGLDFGPVNTAAVFYAERPTDKKLLLYRTYHYGGRTARQHVVAMLEGEPKNRLPLCYGGSRSEQEWRNDFMAAGLPVAPSPIVDVEVGITRVWGCHNRADVLVFKDLDEYRTEKLSYSRELDVNNDVTEKIKDKHAFHLMDAERYVLGAVRPGNATPAPKDGQITRDTGQDRRRKVSILGKPVGFDEETGKIIRGQPKPGQISQYERQTRGVR